MSNIDRRTALLMAASAFATSVSSQTAYPSRPISIVIGYTPGTSVDNVARPVVDEMSKRMGQPFVFDFKPGASGTIAAKHVANARPDGYTLLFTNLPTSGPVLVKTNAVEAKDFTAVSAFAKSPWVLFVRSSLPVRSWPELLAYSKQNPGKLNSGTPGGNSLLALHMLKMKTGLSAEAIPYPANPQVATAMLAGDVDIFLGSPQSHLPYVGTGGLRPLLVASSGRYSALPDVPTTKELNIPDLEIASVLSLWAPARTPPAVVDRLYAEASTALKVPAIVESLRKNLAVDILAAGPEESLRIYEQEVRFWAEAARLTNYQPQ